MSWTQEDSLKMDAAAYEAEQELRQLKAEADANNHEITAQRLMAWWHKWFMRAGHKRLYKIADRIIP